MGVFSRIFSRRPPPASPCIKVCVLHQGHGYCMGCLRTGDEIGRWSDMSEKEQWALLDEIERRRAQLKASDAQAAVTARRELE